MFICLFVCLFIYLFKENPGGANLLNSLFSNPGIMNMVGKMFLLLFHVIFQVIKYERERMYHQISEHQKVCWKSVFIVVAIIANRDMVWKLSWSLCSICLFAFMQICARSLGLPRFRFFSVRFGFNFWCRFSVISVRFKQLYTVCISHPKYVLIM